MIHEEARKGSDGAGAGTPVTSLVRARSLGSSVGQSKYNLVIERPPYQR